MSDVPELSSDEENFEEEEWQEMELADTEVTCLFCSKRFPVMEEAIKHCESEHNFSIIKLKAKLHMDCYSYIKMINYIKTHKPTSEVIMHMSKPLWDDEKYFQPVDSDEWLMFDFESLTERPTSPRHYHVNVENGLITLTQTHFDELNNLIQSTNDQLKVTQSHLQMAKDDIKKMKESMRVMVDSGKMESEGVVINSVCNVPLEYDEGYFNSYAHFGVHYEMLSDKVRTESYQKAISNNKETIRDKIVLDLGCGTGILSIFAATAGAKSVIALDQSDIVYHAMDIIRENNLQNTIKVIKGRLENTKLEEKFDIIISEWMGYFLLFEGMLDSVVYARDHFLKPGGLLYPNRCNISLVANGDLETHNKFINFWSNVYGYKMNCMKSEVVKEASIDIVDAKNIISEPCIVKEIDINTCETDVIDFTADFKLPITKDGCVTSIVGYFDTFFELPNAVSFSTGPHATPTHWKQTVFYFKDVTEVKAGDILVGKIICNRQKPDVRALTVEIEMFD